MFYHLQNSHQSTASVNRGVVTLGVIPHLIVQRTVTVLSVSINQVTALFTEKILDHRRHLNVNT